MEKLGPTMTACTTAVGGMEGLGRRPGGQLAGREDRPHRVASGTGPSAHSRRGEVAWARRVAMSADSRRRLAVWAPTTKGGNNVGAKPALLLSGSTAGTSSCPLEPSVSAGMLPLEERVPVHGEDARELSEELLDEELKTRLGMSTGAISKTSRSWGKVHRRASHKQGYRRVRYHASC